MTTLALLNNVPRRVESGVILTTALEQQFSQRLNALTSQARAAGVDLSDPSNINALKAAREAYLQKQEDKRKERDANFKFSKSNAMLARVNANFLATSGVSVNSSQSYAVLSIYENNALITSSDKFLLSLTSESDGDRIAPIFTFGTPICYTAGRRPRLYSYSGEFLVNQKDKNSKDEFWTLFEKYGRASSAIIGRADQYVTELKYQNRVIKGVMTALETPITAADTHKIPFNFSLFVYEEISS
jgi:hypothetical protein